MVLGGAVFAALTCVRYFTNDRGQTIAERGFERLRTTTARAQAVRAFAVIGAVQLCFLVAYHLPTGFLALNAESWPKDIQQRSYFANGICGPHTVPALTRRSRRLVLDNQQLHLYK
jgi:hypothetical protein